MAAQGSAQEAGARDPKVRWKFRGTVGHVGSLCIGRGYTDT